MRIDALLVFNLGFQIALVVGKCFHESNLLSSAHGVNTAVFWIFEKEGVDVETEMPIGITELD